jgi:ABC-type sugar transport system substrate-binding protein
MTRPEGSSPDSGGLLGGEPVQRRAFLRMAAGATLGLPFVLAACGEKTPVAASRSDFVINAIGGSPPPDDFGRLLAARAQAKRAIALYRLSGPLSVDSLLVPRLREESALGLFDPALNKRPPIHALIVAPAVHLELVEPLLANARAQGIKVVVYPRPVQAQDAAIVADSVEGATILARHAAAWARSRIRGRGEMLLVMPRADQVGRDPFAPASDAERAIRATLAHDAPGLKIATTVRVTRNAQRDKLAPALAAHPAVRVVLLWDDGAAPAAASALRARHPAGTRDQLYVGAMGAPAVASRATFDELKRDDVLRVVVATGARDLANAMIDLPLAVLQGKAKGDVRLPFHTLTPGSSALRRYSADYATRPSGKDYSDQTLYTPSGNLPPATGDSR